ENDQAGRFPLRCSRRAGRRFRALARRHRQFDSRGGKEFLCGCAIQRAAGCRPISQPARHVSTSIPRRVLWPWLGSRARQHRRSDSPVLLHRRGHRRARFPALLPHTPPRRAPLHLHAPAFRLYHLAPGRHHLARHFLFPRRSPPPPLIRLIWSAAACRRFCTYSAREQTLNPRRQHVLHCHSDRRDGGFSRPGVEESRPNPKLQTPSPLALSPASFPNIPAKSCCFNARIRSRNCAAFSNSNFFAASLICVSSFPRISASCASE